MTPLENYLSGGTTKHQVQHSTKGDEYKLVQKREIFPMGEIGSEH